MNAPSLNEIRGAVNRDMTDEKMEQVREILIGDSVRRMEARVAFLETRLNEFEVSIGRQLDALEARIEALAGAADGERRVTFDALSVSVAGLATRSGASPAVSSGPPISACRMSGTRGTGSRGTMSQSVDRLKELLFNTETHALEELARRIDGITQTEARTRADLTERIDTAAVMETRARDDLIRRVDGIAASDARARDEFKMKLDEVYARAGNTEHMTASVADILGDALRRAEVDKHMELSQTIAPLVVTTIKAELRNSQDEMVEALYPITGRLVKSYVAAAIKDLTDQMNRRLEHNPLMLRLQSLTTGRSVGELALAGTQDFDVKELYLIRRGSGELVAHWPEKAISGREHAMSGVLAAVNEFANDAFSADQSCLRQIDLGGEEVYLRGSPIYLLAARCSGQAPKSVEQTLDDAFLSAVEAQHSIDKDPASARRSRTRQSGSPRRTSAPV